MRPIFIISLPRSGSTLLQRMLMAHQEVATVSEPWLLLPIVYMLPESSCGVTGPYNHRLAQKAIHDFVQSLPHKENDYWQAVRGFVSGLYADVSDGGSRYFLDKTPRYYLIIPQIRKIFPDAKFIFLFRNPLAVLSSIVDTWGYGRFGQFYQNHADLYNGPLLMTKGVRELGKDAISVCYEDLVSHPEVELERILGYLDLNSEMSEMQFEFDSNLKGHLGDKTGIKKYNQVTSKNLNAWVGTYNSYARRWYAQYYLKKIGDDILLQMGYERKELLKFFNETSGFIWPGFIDTIDMLRVYFYQIITSDKSKKIIRKLLIPGNLFWKKNG